jgi:hypothetical protein
MARKFDRFVKAGRQAPHCRIMRSHLSSFLFSATVDFTKARRGP